MAENARRAEIARLNDRFRSTGEGGQIFHTAGIAGLPLATMYAVVSAVRHFDKFTPDNDPYGEHDCASLVVAGHRIIWKIDYYPADDIACDPDPASSKMVKRVMTIMLGEEY